jgi:hypothetical protein
MSPGQHERLGQLRAEMEKEVGAILADLLDEARRRWRPKGRDDDSLLVDVGG